MLTRLYIKDFALIEEAVIEFGPGLNVVTGETGAGKSILIGALNSILGGPVNADLVRKEASSCAVEGFFELDDQGQIARLADLGVLLEDGQLILRREVRSQGRSRAFVNGQGQPIKQLKQIGSILVDLHGQTRNTNRCSTPSSTPAFSTRLPASTTSAASWASTGALTAIA